MSNCTYFSLECPTCGRRLQIRVEYLGRKVQCQHCGGMLTACDPAGTRYTIPGSTTLLEQAEVLLESVAKDDEHPRAPNPR